MASSVSLPTQELPFYLSASTFTVTTNGVVTTGVSTVNVPITYFGPSIPLGPDDVWTFGGSTSPPPTTSISTAIPTSTSSIITTTDSLSITTTNPPTTPPTTLLPTTISETTSSSTPTAGASSSSINLRRVLPGVIIAAIVAILAVILIFILCRYRRRRINAAYQHPNFSDFILVDSEGQRRLAGVGVPRPTGGEEDPFLRRSVEVVENPSSPGPSGPPPRLVSSTPPPRASTPEGARAIKDVHTRSPPMRKDNPFFHASHSSLFFNPSRGPDPSVLVATPRGTKRESSSTQQSSGPSVVAAPGSIIGKKQLMQMDDEWQGSGPAESSTMANVASRHGTTELGERENYNTPLPPPPVLNPDGIPTVSRPNTRQSSNQAASAHTTLSYSRAETPGSEPDERATLLTARRVQMNEGGPSMIMHPDAGIPSSWGTSLGIGLSGLTRISRMSWFQRMESLRAGSPDGQSQRFRRHNRSLSPNRSLHQPQMTEATSVPVTRSELRAPRPLSNVSMGSKSSAGDTVFHDARSTMSSRSMPVPTVSGPVPPLPTRPITPEVPRMTPESEVVGKTETQSQDVPNGYGMISPAPRATSPLRQEHLPQQDDSVPEIDILDIPVPAQLRSFSSASSRGGPMFPPGLEQHMTDMNLSNVNLWRESASDMPSAASFSGSSGVGPSVSAVGIGNIDNLDDAPPLPREGWAQMRAATISVVDNSRRTTHGQPTLVDLPGPNGESSEHGSLHSLAHLNPFSPSGSANSRAPSRGTFYGSSMGSNSSRSRFADHSHSSRPSLVMGASLQHSNSVSSDGRRKQRRSPGEPTSETDSPFGSMGQYGRARLSAVGGSTSMPQLSPFGGGFLTSASNPNFHSSRSGSNQSSHHGHTADLDAVSPTHSAFGAGLASDGHGTGPGSVGATTATSTCGTTTATTSEGGNSTCCTSVMSHETARTTVGECPEPEVVPFLPAAVGSGPDRRQRGTFPNSWLRAGTN